MLQIQIETDWNTWSDKSQINETHFFSFNHQSDSQIVISTDSIQWIT